MEDSSRPWPAPPRSSRVASTWPWTATQGMGCRPALCGVQRCARPAGPDPDEGAAVRVLLAYPKTPDTFWSFKHVVRLVSRQFSQAIELAIVGHHFRRVAASL